MKWYFVSALLAVPIMISGARAPDQQNHSSSLFEKRNGQKRVVKHSARLMSKIDKAKSGTQKDPWVLSTFYLKRAELKVSRKDELGAIEDYSTAIQLLDRWSHPYSSPTARNNALAGRGNLYVRRKNFKEAIRDLNEAIAKDPFPKRAWFVSRGQAYEGLGCHHLAKRDFDTVPPQMLQGATSGEIGPSEK